MICGGVLVALLPAMAHNTLSRSVAVGWHRVSSRISFKISDFPHVSESLGRGSSKPMATSYYVTVALRIFMRPPNSGLPSAYLSASVGQGGVKVWRIHPENRLYSLRITLTHKTSCARASRRSR